MGIGGSASMGIIRRSSERSPHHTMTGDPMPIIPQTITIHHPPVPRSDEGVGKISIGMEGAGKATPTEALTTLPARSPAFA
jgi:hypothetical protein